MKSIYSPSSTLVRSVIAITLGAVLILWPAQVNAVIVRIIGVLFVIPSIVNLIALSFTKKEEKTKKSFLTTLATTALAIFGLIMIFYPGPFVPIFVLLVGIILFLSGAIQIIGVFKYCIHEKSFWLMLVPFLVLLMGVITIFSFEKISEVLLVIVGITLIVYGISEIFNFYKILHLKKLMQKQEEMNKLITE